MPRRLLVLLLALALPITLAACGGDDDDGGGEDEDQITEVIETSISSTDPADCTTVQTQAFLDQTQGETGEAAVQSCEESATDTTGNPESTEVTEVSVDGDTATADASFEGGFLDGSTISVALVKEGDQWKLDQLTDIPEFDFAAFQASFAAELDAQGDIPPEVTDCIKQAFDDAGEEQIKSVILNGEQEQLGQLIQGCAPAPTG